jgi:hypothetical protein
LDSPYDPAPMRARAKLFVPFLALVALVAAGCGGGSDTIPNKEYVKRVKDRCTAYKHERDQAQKEIKGNPLASPEKLKAAAPAIVTVNDTLRKAVSDLKVIPDPKKGANRVQSTFAAVDEGMAALTAADAAAREGDLRGIKRAFKEVNAAFARANKIGRELGFGTCSG